MLAVSPRYSPTVLYARQRVQGNQVEQLNPIYGKVGIFLPGIYRLILVEEGSCRVTTSDGTMLLREGQIGFLQPETYSDISMANYSRAQMIGFVACGIEGCRRDRRMLFPPDDAPAQPTPEELWECSIPNLLPTADLPSVVEDIRHIAAIWWQDDWHHFVANDKLRHLLFAIVQHQRSMGAMRQANLQHDDPQEMQDGELDGRLPDHSHNNLPNNARNNSHNNSHNKHPSQPLDSDQGVAQPRGPEWVTRIQQLIDVRLPVLHSTADLAAAIDRNPQAMARVFRQHIGVTPAVYLRQRRLERTIELVRSTRLSMQTIATQVGYRSVAALDQAWRLRFDVSPTVWRQRH